MMQHIVVINLDRDVGRMGHMHAQLESLGLPYERFSALQGDRLPTELARYFPYGAPLSPGEIGCYASHLAIMQRIARGDQASPTLVLEDDVGLPADLAAALGALAAALPAQWDIVRLSYHTKFVSCPVAHIDKTRTLVRYSRVPTTTGAYLISASGAHKLIAKRPRAIPIDHDLRRVWNWNLDTYGINPPLVRHDVLQTSSIDQLSPQGRARCRRRAARFENPLARARQGVHDLGLRRWLACGALNAVARITPKPARPAFVQWANAKLT